MTKKLVVPLDGSKIAEKALDAAVYLARAYQTKLLLVQVCALPVTMVEAMGPNYYQLREDCLKSSERYLTETAEKLNLGDQVEVKVVEGHPTDLLLDVCDEFQADMVIMTSHGRSGIDRWFLGSVTENFARRSVCPVLVLRGDKKVSVPLGHKILIPLDGSTLAEGILPAAQQLAKEANGELVLLRSHHGTTSYEFASHDVYPGHESREGGVDGAQLAEKYLSETAQKISEETGLKVSHNLTDNYPPEGILKGAQECEADLIAMTSHGATGLAKWIFGSVAEKVLRHADRPVLILKSEWSRQRD
jgi:nucleotide-binding universal stress UspA family protein